MTMFRWVCSKCLWETLTVSADHANCRYCGRAMTLDGPAPAAREFEVILGRRSAA